MEILRNVETKEKVLSATEKSDLLLQQQKNREAKVTVRSGSEFKPGEEQVRGFKKKQNRILWILSPNGTNSTRYARFRRSFWPRVSSTS